MSHVFFAIAMIAAICVVGFTALVRRQLANVKKIDFLQEYLNEFSQFASSYLEDKKPSHKRYDWLVKNSDKAQSILGSAGIIQYQAPFGRFSSPNYALIVNTIPKFTDGMGPARADLSMVDVALRRAIGIRQERTELAIKSLKNPIRWLTTGVGSLLLVPLTLLKELGIVSGNFVSSVKASGIFRFLTGLLSLIGILETAIGIILGKSFIIIAFTWIIEKIGG